MKQSAKYSLNRADIEAQLRSAFIFLAPSLLAFLVVLIPAVNSITPDTTGKLFVLVVVKWILDQLTGLLRRYVAGK